MNQRNQYDRNGECLKQGNLAEKRFEKMASEREWTFRHANENEDKYQHWDYAIAKARLWFRVEVKGLKKLHRHDAEVQDRIVWVELKGVRDKGWIYGGRADLIAFELFTGFIIVERKDLAELVDCLVERVEAKYGEDGLYKLFHREDRNDETSQILTDDLKPLVWQEWKEGGE